MTEHRFNLFAKAVIDELGGVTRVAGICKVRPASVGYWKKSGIPPAREMYLRTVYPSLKAWSMTTEV